MLQSFWSVSSDRTAATTSDTSSYQPQWSSSSAESSSFSPFDPVDIDLLLASPSTCTLDQSQPQSYYHKDRTINHHRHNSSNYYKREDDEPSFYGDFSQSSLDNQHKVPNSLDISSLDDILDRMSETTKTTTEWRSSFRSMRDRFGAESQLEHNVPPPIFTTGVSINQRREITPTTNVYNGNSQTLPRNSRINGCSVSPLSKSSSITTINAANNQTANNERKSLLADAIEKKCREEEEETAAPIRTSELNSFWLNTINCANLSSTAATNTNGSGGRVSPYHCLLRFDELNEIVDESGTIERRRRRSSSIGGGGAGESLSSAAKRVQFLRETFKPMTRLPIPISQNVNNNFTAVNNRSKQLIKSFMSTTDVAETAAGIRSITPYSIKTTGSNATNHDLSTTSASRQLSALNFNELDSAVAESPISTKLQTNTQRFPINCDALAAPMQQQQQQRSTMSAVHSPSPDSTMSQSSDCSVPSGLPYPPPKHHIREQLLSFGIEPRSPHYNYHRPATYAFPVPTTGNVASRISEIEKRPNRTPNLLQIACALQNATPVSSCGPGPMSPRMAMSQSTVYRTKPIIHLQMLSSSPSKSPVHSPRYSSSVAVEACTTEEELFNFKQPNVLHENERKTVQPLFNHSASSITNSVNCRFHILDDNSSAGSSTRTLPPLSSSTKLSSLHYQRVRRQQRPPSADIIPRFYYPHGKPISQSDNAAALQRVETVFNQHKDQQVTMLQMADVCSKAAIPIYWKRPVFDACGGIHSQSIRFRDFAKWWNEMTAVAHDEAARFVYTLVGASRSYLQKNDFEPLLQDLIETFPGLHFLRDAKEFHSRYVQTVIVRIFFSVNRSWSGKITASELRNSNFLRIIRMLEETDDINTITDYFSYEHFYVIYCKFWELDKDHDLVIDKIDMEKHANGALPSVLIDRIFSGAVTRGTTGNKGPMQTMTYMDFVAFLLAEEDKRHPTSIEYWFRCLDLDGDGVLSLYELQYFYTEIARKMENMGIESMKFDDVACQLLDLINPKYNDRVLLSDLKRCNLCTRFFNAFINVHKYYDQESADGERATVKNDADEEISDWDRFCAEEYELLMQDEQTDDMELMIEQNASDDDDDDADPNTVTATINLNQQSRSIVPEMHLRRSPLLIDTL